MRPTINRDLERLQKEIEEATEKFLNNGGKIDQREIGETKTNPNFNQKHKPRKQRKPRLTENRARYYYEQSTYFDKEGKRIQDIAKESGIPVSTLRGTFVTYGLIEQSPCDVGHYRCIKRL